MNKVCLSLLLTTLTTISSLAACSDDPSAIVPGAGGEGGDEGGAGTPSGGKASGGTNTMAGGAAGERTAAGGGGQPSSEGGAGGEAPSAAGAGGEAASAAGAGGMGGAGADVTYQCNDVTLTHKFCSALKAAACTPATDCADCVTTYNSQRGPFADCAPCASTFDAYLQCAVDAFEGGDVSAGVECVPDYGADGHSVNCAPILFDAFNCLDYSDVNSCPAEWPIQ